MIHFKMLDDAPEIPDDFKGKDLNARHDTFVAAIATWHPTQSESDYTIVAGWVILRETPNYWRSFGYTSEAEFLRCNGFPDVQRLEHLLTLVELVNRETFITLGADTLDHLVSTVSQHQDDPEERAKDYEAIWDMYGKTFDTYDRATFHRTVTDYVTEMYEPTHLG
jgi:hypothetical protein